MGAASTQAFALQLRMHALAPFCHRGGHVYRNIYINWHQRNRMPTSPYSGQRFVRIASNMSKIGHVGQWCTLKSAGIAGCPPM